MRYLLLPLLLCSCDSALGSTASALDPGDVCPTGEYNVFDSIADATEEDIRTRDSTIDVSTEINAALLVADGSDRRSVFFPSGLYYVGDTIDVPAQVTLRGASSGLGLGTSTSELRATSSFPEDAPMVSVQDIDFVITGMTLNGDDYGDHGIFLESGQLATGARIERTAIRRFNRSASQQW